MKFTILRSLLLLLLSSPVLSIGVLVAEVDAASDGRVTLHAPVGEDGEGLYTASTKGCFDVISAASPLVLSSMSSIPLPPPGVALRVSDYGTADAGTSLGLMSSVVDAARSRSPGIEVVLQYEDQKDNEWRSVFNHALGHKPVTDAYGNVDYG
mmetsp:Transcript_7229/g.14260  ORF Transcript_7229/g.14260 Transcript_7229/m.14260 type:complete len:153 (-) Transcript_7229:2-460(-)